MGKALRFKRIPPKYLRSIAFCVICTALNVAGANLALSLELPVYMDCLGTILAAIVGGHVPGIVVGYLTNLFVSLEDPTSMYYGIINVLVAVLAASFAHRDWFHKLSLTICAGGLIGLASGTLGSLLAFFLNKGSLSDEVSAPFANQLYIEASLDLGASQFIAELFVNVVDKLLVVLFAALVFHMLSDSFLESLDFAPWRQKPLSHDELNATLHVKPRGMSLSTKIIVVVASIVSFVAAATLYFSYMSFHRSTIKEESNKAQGIANLMEKAVDADRVEDFLANGEETPGYLETEADLASIRDSFENVQYVYVYQIQDDGCHVVLDPDTADEPGSDPGTVVPFDPSFSEYLPTLLEGGEIDPIVSNDSYGWLLTVYKPLKNSSGETVCYLGVDISMERLVGDERSFLAGTISLFLAFFILVCSLILWMARYGIILPINSIARATNAFVLDDANIRSGNVSSISSLDISTGNEIESLYDAVSQMSESVVNHVAEAQDKSEAIARMQSNLIMVLADIVESRDKFTGDHVRNTATYALIIMNQMRCEGICTDVLTNEFISNVYQSAPLHDIGKIAVSDLILNKPARLTDEEFAIMKSHTLAGQEILESAKSAVSESSYLDEAQRLAAYHHEKWNGSGYPYGLAGEDIPLSARIMAVADVFDALVSKRSYKAGFPVEKAFAIIEEGIGTHFDPQVARAFLHAKDKAIVVATRSNEKKRLEEENARKKTEAEEEAKADDGKAHNGNSDHKKDQG